MSIRALIIELAQRQPGDEELYDACAMLGRLVARQGGSPTLAASTIDHAHEALGAVQATWLVGARAAVCEGFSAGLVELAAVRAQGAWEFPHCAIALGAASVAIAAGHPSDDRELLEGWAARAARSAALLGIRRAFLSGREAPRRAMGEALSVAGIEVRDGSSFEPTTGAGYEGSRT